MSSLNLMFILHKEKVKVDKVITLVVSEKEVTYRYIMIVYLMLGFNVKMVFTYLLKEKTKVIYIKVTSHIFYNLRVVKTCD